jgi:excinuclease ABC subunit A
VKIEPDISLLSVIGAHEHNLKNINVSFPIGAFSVVTGVSGSGKSSLVHDIIWKSLTKIFHRNTNETAGKAKSITGIENLNKVISVNQQPIGQTPNSNPATYTGMFDLIRELFAKLPDAKVRGYTARRFSFNTPDGRCEKCEGAGQIKIEMHFLPDVWITCDACNGKRYDRQTLEIKYHGYSIADVLEMTCADALKLFADIPRIRKTLQLLCDVGLDYLALGQPAPTLSGGESQRIKLTSELTRPDTGHTLYLLDEPTTGLHFDDMNKLLQVIHRLADLGNTIIVIEHNLDIIKNADWIVDLGPEAGDNGGYLLFEGTPEELVNSGAASHTANVLIPVLKNGLYQERTPFNPKTLIDPPDNKIETTETNFDAELPWKKNGMKWHTKEHICRNGNQSKWDGKILQEIVSRIETTNLFTPIDWSHRYIVEIFAEKKSLGWFMQAITSNEWFLTVKFKTAGGTFKRDQLIKSLALKPFSEIDKVPIYSTEPRVKVQRLTIHWQEIELLICSYDEIDRPEFYEFLDTAIQGFNQYIKSSGKSPPQTIDLSPEKLMEDSLWNSSGKLSDNPRKKSPDDYLPWCVLGEKWHLLRRGFPRDEKIMWKPQLLVNIFNILRENAPNAEIVWTAESYVKMYCMGRKGILGKNNIFFQRLPWVKVWTKRSKVITVDLYVTRATVTLEQIKNIGNSQKIINNEEYDIINLNFTEESDLPKSELTQLLIETM